MFHFCEECNLNIRDEDVSVEEYETMGVVQRFISCPCCGDPLKHHYDPDAKIYEPYFKPRW